MCKRILVAIFCAIWVLPLFAQSPLRPSSGQGTSKSPFLIESLAHLRWLSEGTDMPDSLRWSAHYRLATNLDASASVQWGKGRGFSPIGHRAVPFRGVFDGDGHYIKGVYVNGVVPDSLVYVGFFGQVKGGKVLRLGLKDAYLKGFKWVGVLAGSVLDGALLKDCYVHGKVEGRWCGGMLGQLQGGSLLRCHAIVRVEAVEAAGGLIGIWQYAPEQGGVSACYVAGPIEKYAWNVRGVAGQYSEGAYDFLYWDRDRIINHDIYSTKYLGEWRKSRDFAVLDKLPGLSPEQWEVRTWSDIDTFPRPYLKAHLGYDASYSFEVDPSIDPTFRQAGVDRFAHTGEVVDLPSPSPRPGYVFLHWTHNGERIAGNQLHLQRGDNLLQAHFALEQSPFQGAGTQESPYRIDNLRQLYALASLPHVWDKHFVLTADIDALDSRDWEEGKGIPPIGTAAMPFKGSFDGQGYHIANLHQNRSDKQASGLFAYARRASISRLGLVKAVFRGGSIRMGILMGKADSTTVDQCHVSGILSISSLILNDNLRMGGMVGLLGQESEIRNSYAQVQITGQGASEWDIYGVMVGETDPSSRVITSYCAQWIPQEQRYSNKKLVGYPASGWAPQQSYVLSQAPSDLSSLPGFSPELWEIDRLPDQDRNSMPYLKALRYGRQLSVSVSPPDIAYLFESMQGLAFAQQPMAGVPEGYSLVSASLDGQPLALSDTLALSEGKHALSLSFRAMDQPFTQGEGTAQNPYRIGTLQELQRLSHMPAYWDRYFLLTADIDATPTCKWDRGNGFWPIGHPDKPFTGALYGPARIRGLHISRPFWQEVGLLGSAKDATISRIGVEQANVFGYAWVGSLAGVFSQGYISESYADAKVDAIVYAGGLVGKLEKQAHVTDFHVHGYVSGVLPGGVVGELRDAALDKGYTDAKVTYYWIEQSPIYGNINGSPTVNVLWNGDMNEYVLTTQYWWDFQYTWQMKEQDGVVAPALRWSCLPVFKGVSWDDWGKPSGSWLSLQPEDCLSPGNKVSYTAVPKEGFRLASLQLDGKDIPLQDTVSWVIYKPANLLAVFEPRQYTLAVTATAGGNVTPSGNVLVKYGASQTFNIRPANGQEVADVLLDGKSIGRTLTYTLKNVREDHRLQVLFQEVILSAADPYQGMRLWPNPTDGWLQLSPLRVGEQIGIFDLQGRLLRRLQATQAQLSIDISSLPAGPYLLQVGSLQPFKLIKK